MESNQEEAISLPVSKENKSDVKQEDYDFMKNTDLKTLFDKLAKFEQVKLKLDRLNHTESFKQIKNFDLIKMLRGTQYSTKIKQFFEFDLIIKKLEECFEKLQCSYHDCKSQAVMAFEGKNREPAVQYCYDHFNNSNNSTESPKYFEFEINLHKILFSELEVQLVYIQDRIDYIKSDETKMNISLYAKIEDEVQRNLNNINSTFKTMTERIYQIDETHNTKTKNEASMINFSDFSFVRKNLDECRDNILIILSLISRPLSMNQAAFLIQVMMDLKKEINLDEERKDVPNASVPHEIYNSDYQMVNFPAQSLQSIKNFEQKIGTVCKYIETCHKGALELVESHKLIKQILKELQKQQELKKSQDQLLLEKKNKEILEKLKLKDAEYYIEEFKDIKEFPAAFKKTKQVYTILGQHAFSHNIVTSYPLQIQRGSFVSGKKYIYFGQLDKETSNADGVGICVDSKGDIIEGYWKNDDLNGFGRFIWPDGTYYIGEWRNGRKNGQGTICCADGRKHIGENKDDRWNGKGTLWLTDGRKYVGDFKDSNFHGKGTEYTADGQISREGVWADNKYIGKG